MVVKFFPNKKGGGTGSIDYLLNKREEQGTARILKGDRELTRDIINSMQFKQKTTVGVLAFEEKDLNEDIKHKIMKEFEEMLLPDFKDRYNILWVEHTDKNNLELNFVIPKIDLESKKALNPYFHKADMKRVDLWQNMINLEHNLTNPKNPAKKRTLETNTKEINLSKDYEQLDKLLHNLVQDQKIQNRDHLIEILENNNIKVTRKNKEGLSIKLPDSKKAKRFKGAIYNEQFTSIGELGEVSQRARAEINQYNKRDTSKEYRRYREEFKRHIEFKARELKTKYKTRQNRNSDIVNTLHTFNSGNILQPTNNQVDIQRKDNNRRARQVYSTGGTKTIQEQERSYILSNRRLEDDSIRTRADERTRAEREAIARERERKLKAYRMARETRTNLHIQLKEDSRREQEIKRGNIDKFALYQIGTRSIANGIREIARSVGKFFEQVREKIQEQKRKDRKLKEILQNRKRRGTEQTYQVRRM